jgi:hypothetical protein
MDKETQEYWEGLRDDLIKRQRELRAEFALKYFDVLDKNAPDLLIEINMETVFDDAPSNLWTPEMKEIYDEARENYQKLQLAESLLPPPQNIRIGWEPE